MADQDDDLGFVPADQSDDLGFVAAPLVAPRAKEPSGTGIPNVGATTAVKRLLYGLPLVGGGVRGLDVLTQGAISKAASAPIEAIAEGGLNTISAGITDALAKQGGANVTNDPNSARFQAPFSYAVGESLGGLVPAGGLTKGATSLAGLIGRSALSGGIYGFGSGASEEVKTSENPTLESVIKAGLIPAAAGIVFGGAVPAIPSAGVKVVQGVKSFFPSISESITRAIRPTNKIGTRWDEIVKIAPQTIADLGDVPVTDLASSIAASKNTQGKLYESIRKVTGNPNAVDVDGGRVYENIMKSVSNQKTLTENPREIIDIATRFKAYDRKMSLDEAETLLEQTNAELFGPLYNRTAEGMKIARSGSEIKAQEALAKSLREQIDDAIENQLGPQGRDLKKTYGAVSTFRREAERRYLVALRQAQNSLPEQLALASSAFDIVNGLAQLASGNPLGVGNILGGGVKSQAARLLKEINTSDAQIATAFGKIRKQPNIFDPASIPVAAPPVIPLNVGGVRPQPIPTPLGPTPQQAAMAQGAAQNAARNQAIAQAIRPPSGPAPLTYPGPNLGTAMVDIPASTLPAAPTLVNMEQLIQAALEGAARRKALEEAAMAQGILGEAFLP